MTNKRVLSFDIFDTIMGRKCGKPEAVCQIIASKEALPSFPELRISAERHLQKLKQEYTLKDIYDFMSRPDLAEVEFEIERANAFKISSYANMLYDECIFVTDMYPTEKQIRTLLKDAGIDFKGKIYVSCYGKKSGEVWKEIAADGYSIIKHVGDNKITDFQSPRASGIKTAQAQTGFSKIEKKYEKVHPLFAGWVRSLRLEYQPEITTDLWQLQLNVPMLWAASELLHDHLMGEGGLAKKDSILFMSRDGQLFKRMFDRLFPHLVDCTTYLHISRDCLRGESKSYFRYLNQHLHDKSILVDLASSLGSLREAIENGNIHTENPRAWTIMYLPSFGVDISKINVSWATTNLQTRCNNTYVEMLNYADHWHVADVRDGALSPK